MLALGSPQFNLEFWASPVLDTLTVDPVRGPRKQQQQQQRHSLANGTFLFLQNASILELFPFFSLLLL